MGTTLDSSFLEGHSSWHIVGTYNRFFLSEHSWDSVGHRHVGASGFIAALHGHLSFQKTMSVTSLDAFKGPAFYVVLLNPLSTPKALGGAHLRLTGKSWRLTEYKTSTAVSGSTCPICLCSTSRGWRPDFWAIHAWGHLARYKVAEAGRGGWLCARPVGLDAFNNWFLLTI